MNKKKSYLDTNILIANFFPEYDNIQKEKNILDDNFFIKNKTKIGNFVLSEFWHILFKRCYKNVYKEKFNGKVPPLGKALKNDFLIGKVNSIFQMICENILGKNIKFKTDYNDMLINILKYKISAADYFIALEAKKKLVTGDEDLVRYLNSK